MTYLETTKMIIDNRDSMDIMLQQLDGEQDRRQKGTPHLPFSYCNLHILKCFSLTY